MSGVKEKKWAAALWNGEFFLLETHSGYRSCKVDPRGKKHILEADASSADLGEALQDALSYSRFLSPEQVYEFFDRQRGQQEYEDWARLLVRLRGYKSKNALFKNMAWCNVQLVDGLIEIVPQRHESLESWGREKDDGIESVVLPVGSSTVVVGEALRLAFSRCR